MYEDWRIERWATPASGADTVRMVALVHRTPADDAAPDQLTIELDVRVAGAWRR
ncbi:MAG TPA: hypothetical protein VEA69_12925 [Tepidisphaeraceae bacterium]|nr:hypothetical protein [Tepidisphaeraceae bacterium]